MSAFETIAIKDIGLGHNLSITAAGAAKVDGSAVIQPVSGTVTIVPSGTQNVNIVSSVSIAVTGPLTDAQLRATPVPVSATNLDIRPLVFATDKVDVSGSSISISASALPIGAATAANQATIIGHIDGIEPLLTTIDADTSNISLKIDTLAGTVSGSEVQVDIVASLPAGTNNIGDVDVITMPGTAAESSALPGVFVVVAGDDGTDTHPLQMSATGDLKVTLDGETVVLGAGSASIGILGANSGVDIGDVTINNGAGASAVHIQDGGNSITVDNNGTFLVQAAQSGIWNIVDISGTISLPTGAATSALQSTGNASLSNIDTKTPSLGQALMASSTPVVIASNQSAIPVSQSGNWSVRVQDGSGNALTSAARGSERALSVQLVDASGNQITSFGGGTQYTEDAPAAADPVGSMSMAVRADSLGAVTSNDGDNIAIRATNKGEIYIKHVDSIPITDNGGSLTVDNSGTFVVQIDGAALSALELIDDAIGTTGAAIPAKGMVALGTDGTNARALKVDAAGELQVDLASALPAGTNTIGNVGHGKTLKTVTSGSTAVTADTDIVAAVALKRIKVVGYAFFTDSTTQNVLVLKSNGAGGTALWTVPLQSPAAGSVFGANLTTSAPGFLFATNAGEKLTLDVGAAVNVWYSITYYDDDTA